MLKGNDVMGIYIWENGDGMVVEPSNVIGAINGGKYNDDDSLHCVAAIFYLENISESVKQLINKFIEAKFLTLLVSNSGNIFQLQGSENLYELDVLDFNSKACKDYLTKNIPFSLNQKNFEKIFVDGDFIEILAEEQKIIKRITSNPDPKTIENYKNHLWIQLLNCMMNINITLKRGNFYDQK